MPSYLLFSLWPEILCFILLLFALVTGLTTKCKATRRQAMIASLGIFAAGGFCSYLVWPWSEVGFVEYSKLNDMAKYDSLTLQASAKGLDDGKIDSFEFARIMTDHEAREKAANKTRLLMGVPSNNPID